MFHNQSKVDMFQMMLNLSTDCLRSYFRKRDDLLACDTPWTWSLLGEGSKYEPCSIEEYLNISWTIQQELISYMSGLKRNPCKSKQIYCDCTISWKLEKENRLYILLQVDVADW